MNSFIKWRMKQFLLFDAALATFIFCLVVLLLHIFIPVHQFLHALDGIRTTVYSTASAACAALLGFIITMATIIGAVIENPQWERFRKSFAYSQVQDIYFNTIRWLGIGTLLFLIFLVIDTDIHPQLLCEIASGWLASIIIGRMWRSIVTLEKLLRMNSFKSQ